LEPSKFMSALPPKADIRRRRVNVRYGQKRTFRSAIAMSALPPKADIRQRDWHRDRGRRPISAPKTALRRIGTSKKIPTSCCNSRN
jgi:hypothetical protein